MKRCEKVPAEREEQPWEEEGGGEGQESPGPGQVYHRREEVLQIPRPSKCQKSWISSKGSATPFVAHVKA